MLFHFKKFYMYQSIDSISKFFIFSQTHSVRCTPCHPGTYSNVSHSASCTSCPKGRFFAFVMYCEYFLKVWIFFIASRFLPTPQRFFLVLSLPCRTVFWVFFVVFVEFDSNWSIWWIFLNLPFVSERLKVNNVSCVRPGHIPMELALLYATTVWRVWNIVFNFNF